MAIEIERKFIFKPEILKGLKGLNIKQGYLQTDQNKTVRARVIGKRAYLTIKGKSVGISRKEFEYEIPYEDGLQILDLCTHSLSKTRYILELGTHKWELDQFHNENEGLYLAEIELKHVEEVFKTPQWIIKEVSDDHRFFNSYLSQKPFTKW